PPTPPASGPRFDVTLTDADGAVDIGLDADTLTITLDDVPGGPWYFGYGQTQVGPFNGWFGEDCYTGDFCHPLQPATALGDGRRRSVTTLTRVGAISAIVEGSTTLLPVDFPESYTPDCTFYIGSQTEPDVCFVFGEDRSYYAPLGCADPGADATTNQ
ncbi:MAG: hypothetical protein KC656_34545, partial [Myxococcales bacterium]|nr:hypothetical protein [Myxococcales bacterium]